VTRALQRLHADELPEGHGRLVISLGELTWPSLPGRRAARTAGGGGERLLLRGARQLAVLAAADLEGDDDLAVPPCSGEPEYPQRFIEGQGLEFILAGRGGINESCDVAADVSAQNRSKRTPSLPSATRWLPGLASGDT
jgi:hypothetical protein